MVSAAAVQIVPLKVVHHEGAAVMANASVVPEATDLRLVGQRDQNEATGTKHAAQAVAVRKHHQNPVALVEALKKAGMAPAQIADIANPDRRLVKTAQIADARVWIAVQDIVPRNSHSEAPAAGDQILTLTHGKMDQVIDDRALTHIVTITDHNSVHIAVTWVTVDPTLDIMPADMVVITPGSTRDMARCTTVDSDHKAVITDQNSGHTTATSAMVDPALDTTQADTVVIIPASTHDTARRTIVDSDHKAVITDRNSGHTEATSAMVDPTLDITQVDMAIISAPNLAHDMVVRCLDIISVHETAMTHTSAHAV